MCACRRKAEALRPLIACEEGYLRVHADQHQRGRQAARIPGSECIAPMPLLRISSPHRACVVLPGRVYLRRRPCQADQVSFANYSTLQSTHARDVACPGLTQRVVLPALGKALRARFLSPLGPRTPRRKAAASLAHSDGRG
eukprot:1780836-Rhodomonas_salina.1